MFGKLGSSELFIILVVVIIVFGPTQLPKLSKMAGKTVKSFKKGLEDSSNDEEE